MPSENIDECQGGVSGGKAFHPTPGCVVEDVVTVPRFKSRRREAQREVVHASLIRSQAGIRGGRSGASWSRITSGGRASGFDARGRLS